MWRGNPPAKGGDTGTMFRRIIERALEIREANAGARAPAAPAAEETAPAKAAKKSSAAKTAAKSAARAAAAKPAGAVRKKR